MNYQELDVLSALLDQSYTSQRDLSQRSGHSLGSVNRALKQLTDQGYINAFYQPTDKALQLQRATAPRQAIILAAGFGMRMVPINTSAPKALLQVHGQTLIERLICQLHQANIRQIRVVVGFMKEQFDYLIDKYGVALICNSDYTTKNNLHSLALALPDLGGSYIVPCDLWFRENPFLTPSLYSWYAVTNQPKPDSFIRANRKHQLVRTADGNGVQALGLCYLTEDDGAALARQLQDMDRESRYDSNFWEDALFRQGMPSVSARAFCDTDAIEINTYEQLRELDNNSNQLKSDAICAITEALQVSDQAITQITVLKKGMTNRSFLFTCNGKRYIMRIPGEGTDQLIARAEEAAVYRVIADKDICDNIAYIDPSTGYKITEYLEGARVCDPLNPQDVAQCMDRLRRFHRMGLQVEHHFDIFENIRFYESLWNGASSCFRDYENTKAQVCSLQDYIDRQEKQLCLTHIDAVPDNFLFAPTADGTQQIRLIDWEYAGMQDPHVDIAMFAIYAMYDHDHIEALIDAYFPEGCTFETRTKIYCYIAACGLLWSNWCEYKRQLGVEFGEYSLRQYRYAKDYYRIASQRIREGE